ncbi:MAG: peptidylprolyl isomerase, partial [Gammaproteobacteria bacterium]|nr:peptidylprolyl isomerase [Gammaproteobacteria bacterium]NDG86570.1 peptidylprolyl isomerase [Gammaproteobacteria bacterium]
MLQAIRERAQGIVAWVMLIVVGVPFMLWGIQNYIDTGKEKPAAVVGDREIFDRDVTRAYEQSLNNLVGLEDYDEQALRKEALERLIRDEVISQSAEERKLTVADIEARSLIQTLPYFQTQGQFDKEKYRIMLAAQNMTPAQFVGQIKRGLRNEQLQQGVMESAFVTKGELETLMRLKNQTRDVRYVKVAVGKSDKVFSDEEVTAFYDAHISEFRNPEQVSVDYVLLNLEEMAKGLEVTQEDLKKLYEEQKTNFGTPERRKISHILITLDGTDEKADQAARQEAEAIRQRILKGEDFKELAKTMSKDPLSGKAGGDLGVLNPDAQEASFTEAAQALKVGETSEPVKTSFGYHLIQVTEVVPALFKP